MPGHGRRRRQPGAARRRAVQLGGPGVRGRGGRRGGCRRRPLDDERPRPGWCRPACAPSGRSPARPPAAWTRPSRCSAGRSRRCCSTAATGRPARCAGTRRAAGLTLLVVDTRASHSLVDGGYAVPPRRTARPPRPARRRPAARRRPDQDAALTPSTTSGSGAGCGTCSPRSTGSARRSTCSRPATSTGLGATFTGLARLAARRLRGVLRGARRRRGHRAGARRARRPDDRRRVRRLGDRAGPGRAAGRGRAAVAAAYDERGWARRASSPRCRAPGARRLR